ncbi:hypothetical protein M758_4G072400 [Ceratodon purpureus]|uniref:Uncharacterized protein n=1 Tax=Ceratodon purpureus TaxID=3225 RepID=A0A8T0I9D7_CERPU|nr:hypothetical protein KC19_4G071700 [Ceratodon purpureus]KAG0618541.1 hypothetical protein M758_4G072400 [Ceratodon purpureus]
MINLGLCWGVMLLVMQIGSVWNLNEIFKWDLYGFKRCIDLRWFCWGFFDARVSAATGCCGRWGVI